MQFLSLFLFWIYLDLSPFLLQVHPNSLHTLKVGLSHSPQFHITKCVCIGCNVASMYETILECTDSSTGRRNLNISTHARTNARTLAYKLVIQIQRNFFGATDKQKSGQKGNKKLDGDRCKQELKLDIEKSDKMFQPSTPFRHTRTSTHYALKDKPNRTKQ